MDSLDISKDIIIVGAGPAGLTLGAAVATRGHRVLVVDGDPGPSRDGSWRRRGVMQFEHAHGFRPQVRDLLLAEWPAAWRRWLELGAVPIDIPTPDGSAPTVGVRSRRRTYELALRRAAVEVPRLTVRTGRVDRLVERGGRVVGAVVDGSDVTGDLVVDAGGRLSRFAPDPTLGADVGMSYVNRTYRRRAGGPPMQMAGPFAWSASFTGYDAYAFLHEHGHFSVVVARPTADAALGTLRHTEAFEAACRAIPALSGWIDPRHAVPTGPVLVGGQLRNVYRRQLARPGLVSIGDTVATTAPTAGRGVAMASMQIASLLALLDSGVDPATIAGPFGAWCDEWIRPWVEDHLAIDAESVRRWHGEGVDLARPLTSAAIVAAAQADPRIGQHISGFVGMTALPASLAPAEPLARAVYETGWRPPIGDGPTRDELVALIRAEQLPRRSESRLAG